MQRFSICKNVNMHVGDFLGVEYLQIREFNLLAQHNQIKLSQVEIVSKSVRQRSDQFHSPVAHLVCNFGARDSGIMLFEFP